ncbi:MAG: nuclear transport factor 2 family protein [Gammaproteobacteria bacterium]
MNSLTACFIALTSYCWLMAANAAEVASSHPAAQTVREFNQAVNTENIEAAVALIAAGGVQFNLRPAHPGMPIDHPLTEDMAAMWQTVGAILFPMTESYERQVEIEDVQVNGELAVVWTQTKTVTLRKGKTEKMILEFSEMYFLVNKDDTGWKIGGTASNRPVDSIPVG